MTPAPPIFRRLDLALSVDIGAGGGVPVYFQHGLCGDARQTAEVFPTSDAFHRVTLECRGHGSSEPGDPAGFSIATFADDLAALIEAQGAAPVVVGGISMGAAIALRLAVRRPDLVRGLILARPAWVADAAPENMRPNAEVGALIARSGAAGRDAFLSGRTGRLLASEAPDNLASLAGFFDRQPLAVTAELLQRIAMDGPGVSEADIAALAVPTLVIGHGRDAVHPLGYAARLAALVPHAELVEIVPKAQSRERYVATFRAALATFLDRFAAPPSH